MLERQSNQLYVKSFFFLFHKEESPGPIHDSCILFMEGFFFYNPIRFMIAHSLLFANVIFLYPNFKILEKNLSFQLLCLSVHLVIGVLMRRASTSPIRPNCIGLGLGM